MHSRLPSRMHLCESLFHRSIQYPSKGKLEHFSKKGHNKMRILRADSSHPEALFGTAAKLSQSYLIYMVSVYSTQYRETR